MKLMRCNNGHYYDIEGFDECPHCKNSTLEFVDDCNNVADFMMTGDILGLIKPDNDSFNSVDPINYQRQYKLCHFCGETYNVSKMDFSSYKDIKYCRHCNAKLIKYYNNEQKSDETIICFLVDNKAKKIVFKKTNTSIKDMLNKLYSSYKNKQLYYKMECNCLFLYCSQVDLFNHLELFSPNNLKNGFDTVCVCYSNTSDASIREKSSCQPFLVLEQIVFKDVDSLGAKCMLMWLLTHNPEYYKLIQEE